MNFNKKGPLGPFYKSTYLLLMLSLPTEVPF